MTDSSSTETRELPPHLTATQTDRGFTHLPPISSTYGGEVTAYESSGASAPYLWLKVRDDDRDGSTAEAYAHLTADDALRLADQLVHLVAGHYQFSPYALAGHLRSHASEVSGRIGEMLAELAAQEEAEAAS